MKILNLIENTEGAAGCAAEHGLCFYIETEKHRLLMDLGPSDSVIKNAEILGVDLRKIDTVILSHGHYDHGGGILPFAELNPEARIYLQESAFGEYYAARDFTPDPEYIGLDQAIRDLPQVVTINGEYRIDDELFLFSGIRGKKNWPVSNYNLRKKEGEELLQDDFVHEQCLVITDGDRRILLSGCAHNGILNILDRFEELCGGAPDIVISGFHMMKKTGYTDEERQVIRDTARKLKKYPTVFYTCHCTGQKAFEMMKKILGDRLQYVRSGEEIPADVTAAVFEERARRKKNYMKLHKFFAWASVFCFFMTMITGYKKR
ncbi:MAG: MBL fold metallo-hydrolase [Stomatobaculum sp.]|nr:MBL fold metallo-hydrolase [Stomatobaculum sp.]